MFLSLSVLNLLSTLESFSFFLIFYSTHSLNVDVPWGFNLNLFLFRPTHFLWCILIHSCDFSSHLYIDDPQYCVSITDKTYLVNCLLYFYVPLYCVVTLYLTLKTELIILLLCSQILFSLVFSIQASHVRNQAIIHNAFLSQSFHIP